MDIQLYSAELIRSTGPLGLSALLVFVLYYFLRVQRGLPVPPGPKGSPLVGVIREIPKQFAFLKFTEWAREYGPIYYTKIGFQGNLFINDPQVAADLFVKRSNIYSDRPPSVIGDIVSRGARSVLMPYNKQWRGIRKLFASLLTPSKCDTIYNKWSEAEAVVTCHDILKYPDDLKRVMNRFSMSVVRSITYGRRAVHRDPHLMDSEEAAKNFIDAFRPGAFIIEYMPWLLKFPRFMQPGITTLEKYRDMEDKFNMDKWQETREIARKYPDRHTIISEINQLHDSKELSAELTEMQCAATAMEIVGCLAKAHEELDRVIGQDRYPSWDEQDKLPYLRALIKEQQRWRPISPFSMSHYTFVEDQYQGYRIPKNTVVRMNIWAMHHDPNRYPDPERFMPERFLNHPLSASAYANSSDVAARDHFAYGSGKRICVGLHLAERNLWNMVSRLIHTFNIEPLLDSDGTPKIPKLEEYTYGLVLLPPNFEAKFSVRSDKIRELLDREFVNTAKEGKLDSWEADV
ncbi:cytochrome P450 [Aspergillus californicus]